MNFVSDAETVVTALDLYYKSSVSGEYPVITQKPLGQLITELDLETWTRTGGLTGDYLRDFVDHYLSATTRLNHPGYLAHQVAVPHFAGTLGSLIDGFTNNPMAIYEMGPGAASIEFFMVNWLLKKVGWQPAPVPSENNNGTSFGGGVLTHGGSMANLTALSAARNRVAPEAWEEGNPTDLVLLASPQCHYSISRAASILGLGQKNLIPLPVDDMGVILPDLLPKTLTQVKQAGKRVLAVVASAASTAAGLYDPLREIGQFCHTENIWFHVDGAHGASALLSDRFKSLLDGVELADSLIWDAHKLLRTPTLCAAVLVRDSRTLDGAFRQDASYLFHAKDQPGYDFLHRTIECTKAGLGLRLFMVVAALGEKGLAGYVERQCDLAIGAYEYLQHRPGFECAVKPQTNILCFRVQGSDELQLTIRDRLINQGDFYLSTTDFNGKRYLRATFMNPETTLDTFSRLISAIEQ